MNFRAELVGSFSVGSNNNPTVEMIEAAFRHHGLNYRYINCEVHPKNLQTAVNGARAMGWLGFNCSIPHKVEVINYLDGLGESASVIGAVNCAVLKDGKYIGENTDGKGFLKSLREKINPLGKSFLIFGAGGAARAISVEVALAGAGKITIVNRDQSRGDRLATLLNEKTECPTTFVHWQGSYEIMRNVDVVVNATSIGMYPHVSQQLDIEMDSLEPHMIVADVIVNPLRTSLIIDAEARGCAVLPGLGMLVNQGVLSVKYWTGVDVDPKPMLDRIREIF